MNTPAIIPPPMNEYFVSFNVFIVAPDYFLIERFY